MSKPNDEGIFMRKGRIKEQQYINTDFEIIDAINETLDSDHLGFYISLKRYINRKDTTKENQITYTQTYLQKMFGITNHKYYKYLHNLYEVGLIDIEKIAIITFYVNFNVEGEKNPLVTQHLTYYSTETGLNMSLKGIEKHIQGYPSELVKVVNVRLKTFYIIHDLPPADVLKNNNYKLAQYRNWNEDMERFKRGEDKKTRKNSIPSASPPSFDNQKMAPFDNQKMAPFDNQKMAPFDNQNVNIRNESSNNINESGNIRINQSKDKIPTDRLIDDTTKSDTKTNIDPTELKNRLISSCYLDTGAYYEEKHQEWLPHVITAITQMCESEYTYINKQKIMQPKILDRLQKLTFEIVVSSIDKVIQKSYDERIDHPIPYIKSVLYNETEQYNLNIQLLINHDIKGGNGMPEITRPRIDIEQTNTGKEDNEPGQAKTIPDIKQPCVLERYKNTEFEPAILSIKAELSQVSFEEWFDTILSISRENNAVVIKAANKDSQKILESRYYSLISEKFSNIGFEEVLIMT